MKPQVKQCSCCGRVHQFGEYIFPPKELMTAIANEEVEIIKMTCPPCWSDVTSKDLKLPETVRNFLSG